MKLVLGYGPLASVIERAMSVKLGESPRMLSTVKPLLPLLPLIFPLLVAAQEIQVQPPNPTSADNIVLRVSVPLTGMTLQPIVFDGSEIRITFRGGSVLPTGETQFVSLGRLSAGTYSVVVIFEFTFGGDVVISTSTLPPFPLVVAAASLPVPSLDFRALIALAVTLALVAMFALRS